MKDLIGLYQKSTHFKNSPRSSCVQILSFAKIKENILVNKPFITTRMHIGEKYDFLYIINDNKQKESIEIELQDSSFNYIKAVDLANNSKCKYNDNKFSITISGKDGSIIKLFKSCILAI